MATWEEINLKIKETVNGEFIADVHQYVYGKETLKREPEDFKNPYGFNYEKSRFEFTDYEPKPPTDFNLTYSSALYGWCIELLYGKE